ncbi:MAG: HEAT repeat domain-containing protein, partial [Armatimonadetes bacterium]|nr:HEAT repeat domain-containing protein [Armatimonadota bacterium]
MIAALFALLIAAQDDTIHLGTVSVGGTQVDVTVPSARGPFDESTPHVEIDGWKFTVDADGNLGVRYRSDGGWGEVADAYPAAALKSASAPEYRVKVFLLTNSEILEHSRDGVWRRRRGVISSTDQKTIFESLARFKAFAEVAASGQIRITFDVTVDDDLLFKLARPISVATHGLYAFATEPIYIGHTQLDSDLLGSGLISDDIAPRIASAAIESDEGSYSGPFSSVLVIHAARTRDVGMRMLDRTPVLSVSWANFSEREPGHALSILLFDAWRNQLSATVQARQMLMPSAYYASAGDERESTPRVFERAVSAEMLNEGNNLAKPNYFESIPDPGLGPKDFSIDDARNFRLLKLGSGDGEISEFAGGPITSGHSTGGYISTVEANGLHFAAVHPLVAARFMQQHPDARAIGILGGLIGDPREIIFQLPNPIADGSHLEALGIEQPSMRAMRLVEPLGTPGLIEFDVSGLGDFAIKPVGDPELWSVVQVTESGRFRRGYAVLATNDGHGFLFRVKADTGLTFKVSTDALDPYVLRLVTSYGQETDIQMFGASRVPSESMSGRNTVIDVSKRPGELWREFKVDVGSVLAGKDVVEIRLAPPQFSGFYERPEVRDATVKVSRISFGPISNPDRSSQAELDEDLAWLAGLSGPLDEAAVERMQQLLADEDLQKRINALGAMTRVKHPELIPHIAPSTASGAPSEAYLAIQALKHQGVDEAWSEIANAAFRGPLSHNYRFAAEALGERPEEVTLTLLTPALLDPSWRTRRAAVRSLNKVEGEQAALVSATALQGVDPDAVVRFEIVQAKRPESELFAGRLLYSAVNDSSEWVRAASYSALIDSQFETIRDQALRGVRDESVFIRLHLLQAMTDSPQEHYRPALRMAVIDGSAVVRAAALRAFAKQPG